MTRVSAQVLQDPSWPLLLGHIAQQFKIVELEPGSNAATHQAVGPFSSGGLPDIGRDHGHRVLKGQDLLVCMSVSQRPETEASPLKMRPDFVGMADAMPSTALIAMEEVENRGDRGAFASVAAYHRRVTAVHFAVPAAFRMRLQLPFPDQCFDHDLGVVGGLSGCLRCAHVLSRSFTLVAALSSP